MAPTTEPRLNVDTLSKQDVLMLFSVLEGELEARDLVIQALRAQRRDAYVWERYGRYDLSDPFLALQRDGEVLQGSVQERGAGASRPQKREGGRGAGGRSDPLAMLRLVVGHCRRMQEKMLKQLAAAESRHRRVIADLEEEKRRHAEDTAEGDDVTCILEKERERLLQQLEFERTKASRAEKENRRLQEQLEDERAQQKKLLSALGRECKRSASRVHQEAQRAADLGRRLERERAASQALRAELAQEKRRAMRTEARREELLAEFDTEREQLALRLRREEARGGRLQEELERLKGEEEEEEERAEPGGKGRSDGGAAGFGETPAPSQARMNGRCSPVVEGGSGEEKEGENVEGNEVFLSNSPPGHSALANGSSPLLSNSSPNPQAAYQAGIHQRFHAARHKFQSSVEQDPQLGSNLPHSPRDLSPGAIPAPPPEGSTSKQAARNTVSQALSRFNTQQGPSKAATSSTSAFGTDYRTVAPSGALSPGVRSPTIPRAERGNPPPIPPKKPGLAETPPSPATLRAAHFAQMSASCGRKSTSENTKEADLLLSSSG
ncbi:CTTNBP2 N-terminal-like protein [Brachyhypopomus gauderio]|uniref:CTTNBP2 N-terminal-like protein n=1 Tax=Brachyhypopomus gauderio TaxID=698409 RepID=UPI0040437564